jgi:quercetin dioxygenase-like cupin family protein
MCGMRIASGILAAGIVATAAAAPGAAVASQHPSGTPTPASQHPSETVSPLLKQPLPNVKGKTFTSEIVYFPPNARAVPHRHGSAFVYAYVLEGTVRSQLAGEPVRTYHQGQNWVEPPGTHHLLTENPSRTKPAKLLVIFVSNTGAKLKINDHPK